MRRSKLGRLGLIIAVTVCAALVVAGRVAADTSYTVVTNVPFTGTPASCTGELVAVQGTMFVKDHVLISGGHIHNEYTDHITDANAVGTVSGARYVLTDTTTESFNASSDTTPSEFTSEHEMTLTRLGEDGSLATGDDLRIHLTAHGTINANGQATADQAQMSEECR